MEHNMPDALPRDELMPKMGEYASRYGIPIHRCLRVAEEIYEGWIVDTTNDDEEDLALVVETVKEDRRRGWPLVCISAAFIEWARKYERGREDTDIPKTTDQFVSLAVKLFGAVRNYRLRMPDKHALTIPVLEGYVNWCEDVLNTCDHRTELCFHDAPCSRHGMPDFLRRLLEGGR